MAKLLRIKDYILFTVALTADIIQEFRNVGELIPGLMEARYGYIPSAFKKESYLTSVSRLLATEEIQKKIDSKGKVVLELTGKGRSLLKRRFPLFDQKKWDGAFMVLVFDIPEEERKIRRVLRNKLIELGFGMLQESVWISPFHFEEDLSEFLLERGYSDYVFVLNAKKVLGRDFKKMVSRVWKLEEINKNYLEVIRKVKEILAGGKEETIEVWNLYFRTLLRDPMLPGELLPDDWKREEASKFLRELLLTKIVRSDKNN